MFPNLNAELARIGKDQTAIATVLKIHKSSVSEKMTGKRDFKLIECKTIKKELFPNKTLDYLFETYDIDLIQELDNYKEN